MTHAQSGQPSRMQQAFTSRQVHMYAMRRFEAQNRGGVRSQKAGAAEKKPGKRRKREEM